MKREKSLNVKKRLFVLRVAFVILGDNGYSGTTILRFWWYPRLSDPSEWH